MLALLTPAKADIIDDPLHGYCNGCADNGTNTPLIGSTFGFQSSPAGATGTLYLDFLVPNTINTATFAAPSVTGATTGTSTLFSTTAWTTDTLQAYLGGQFAAGLPSNPIGAYLPSTQTVNAAATGFYDYILSTGSRTLGGTDTVPTALWTLTALLPVGSYIVGKMVTADGTIMTANSGALFVGGSNPPPPPPPAVPLPGAVWLFGAGLLGLVGLARKKKQAL